VMDKAEIRAKDFGDEAEKLVYALHREGNKEYRDIAKAALTAAYDAGWNEAVEAARQIAHDEGDYVSSGLIRRLRIEKGLGLK